MVDYSESIIALQWKLKQLEQAFQHGTQEEQHKQIGRMMSELAKLNNWAWDNKK